MNRRLILYTGSLCHLCESARSLVYPLLPAGASLAEVAIDDDPALRARYGLRIPVLAVVGEDGEVVVEKGWPFSAGQARRLLAHL